MFTDAVLSCADGKTSMYFHTEIFETAARHTANPEQDDSTANSIFNCSCPVSMAYMLFSPGVDN